MNIALHICCAPCAIHPIEALRKEGHNVGGFCYNPNIHPYSEYLKRKDEIDSYVKTVNFTVTYADYGIEEYFQYIVYNEALESRCPVCWWLRMQKTAKFAKENGFDAFTTTLLGSPYQDHETLTKICEEVARNAGVAFHYVDFRKGFKEAHERAKKLGIYCQNYCGCIFSERERLEQKRNKIRVSEKIRISKS